MWAIIPGCSQSLSDCRLLLVVACLFARRLSMSFDVDVLWFFLFFSFLFFSAVFPPGLHVICLGIPLHAKPFPVSAFFFSYFYFLFFYCYFSALLLDRVTRTTDDRRPASTLLQVDCSPHSLTWPSADDADRVSRVAEWLHERGKKNRNRDRPDYHQK